MRSRIRNLVEWSNIKNEAAAKHNLLLRIKTESVTVGAVYVWFLTLTGSVFMLRFSICIIGKMYIRFAPPAKKNRQTTHVLTVQCTMYVYPPQA